MNVELLEKDSPGDSAFLFEVRFLQIIKIELRFLKVALSLLIDVAITLLLLNSLRVLKDIENIFVELITEIAI